jgi:hypothetical protein
MSDTATFFGLGSTSLTLDSLPSKQALESFVLHLGEAVQWHPASMTYLTTAMTVVQALGRAGLQGVQYLMANPQSAKVALTVAGPDVARYFLRNQIDSLFPGLGQVRSLHWQVVTLALNFV